MDRYQELLDMANKLQEAITEQYKILRTSMTEPYDRDSQGITQELATYMGAAQIDMGEVLKHLLAAVEAKP